MGNTPLERINRYTLALTSILLQISPEAVEKINRGGVHVTKLGPERDKPFALLGLADKYIALVYLDERVRKAIDEDPLSQDPINFKDLDDLLNSSSQLSMKAFGFDLYADKMLLRLYRERSREQPNAVFNIVLGGKFNYGEPDVHEIEDLTRTFATMLVASMDEIHSRYQIFDDK